MAGPIYTGNAYPDGFDDARFYADYAQGWIKYQTPDNQIFDFAGGLRALVELELGPDGNIYFIEFLNGALKRFVYDPGSSGQSFSAILRSVNSDKCATVPDGSDVDGRQLVQADCSNADGQIFDMHPIDGGYNIVVGSNGKCLDIEGAQTSAGAALIQWSCHGGANQVFQLSDQGDGTFEIIADFSGQCVDVYEERSDNGAPLVQWPCHGGANQLWHLERIDMDNQPPILTAMDARDDTVGDMILLHPEASDPDGDPLIFSATGLPPDLQLRPRVGEIGGTLLEAGTYNVTISVSDGRGGSDSTTFQWIVRPADGGPAAVVDIVSVNSDLCVDIYAASTSAGAKTIQWPCHNGLNQQFELRPSGTVYHIAAVHSGLCLQPSQGSTAAGATVEQAVCDGNASQRFLLRPSGNDYEIVGQSSDLCLDVAGGSIFNGAGIIQWPCHGGANQLWRIDPIDGSTLLPE